MEYLQLKSKIKIPALGFGPGIMGYSAKMQKSRSKIGSLFYRAINKFFIRPKHRKHFANSIKNALKIGYWLFDYSNTYENLKTVGKAIHDSGIPRNKLFITTRIGNSSQFNNSVRIDFEKALEEMGMEYVDLLQFHWPVTGKYIDTWKEMIKLKEEGKVKVLGVANCHPHHIEALEAATGVLPEINQIEVHPLFTQKSLIEYCREKGIVVEAYTPVARYDDRLVRLPVLKALEKKYNKSFVQIVLRWHIQNGCIPVVRALSEKHQKENIDIFDFEISDEDMKLIDGININSRLRYDPDNCDFTIL